MFDCCAQCSFPCERPPRTRFVQTVGRFRHWLRDWRETPLARRWN